jgi:hypothetical protein
MLPKGLHPLTARAMEKSVTICSKVERIQTMKFLIFSTVAMLVVFAVDTVQKRRASQR